MKPTGATKEAAGHSPLPWRVRDEDGTLGSVVDAEENMVAQTQQQLADPRHHKRRANAQLIVTAVNERERLLATPDLKLRTALAEVRTIHTKRAREYGFDDCGCSYCVAVRPFESDDNDATTSTSAGGG